MLRKLIGFVTGGKHPSEMSPNEYLSYCRSKRRDEAWREINKNPEQYHPPFVPSEQPVCPHCSSSLGNRKTPSRRSKLSCKKCGDIVYVDPHQMIFGSIYLNKRKSIIAKAFDAFGKNIYSAGTTEDFWWAVGKLKHTTGRSLLTENQAGDVLWYLMNYSVANMNKILPKNEHRLHQVYAQSLQDEMRRFQGKEKEGKTASKKKGSGGAMAEFVCPNCYHNFGKHPQPSRRSTRKCKECGESISVETEPLLFERYYLTNDENYVEVALSALGSWVGTKGGKALFNRKAKELGLALGMSVQDMARAVALAYEENIKNLRKQAEKEAQKMEKYGLDYKPDYTMAKIVQEYLDELKEHFGIT